MDLARLDIEIVKTLSGLINLAAVLLRHDDPPLTILMMRSIF